LLNDSKNFANLKKVILSYFRVEYVWIDRTIVQWTQMLCTGAAEERSDTVLRIREDE
jgi:hypothetical protein